MKDEKSIPYVGPSEERPENSAALGSAARIAAGAATGRTNEGGIVADQPPIAVEAVEGSGAPPTNRAPVKCKEGGFLPLLLGVDSLYLSYPGKLDQNQNERLAVFRDCARSENGFRQATAQFELAGHLFEVLPHGAGRFRYVLVDNCFRIQLKGGSASKMPLAYVQVSAEYLAHVGVEEAEKNLRLCVASVGNIEGNEAISRADLFLDFVCDVDFNAADVTQWICRSEDAAKYWKNGQLTGWTFGMGGDIAGRIYDKTEEIKKSKKDWIVDLWKPGGYLAEHKVWRVEFECKRGALGTLGINTITDLLTKQRALWQYLCEDWLRFSVPSSTDKTRSRWPNHSVWDAISAAFLVDGLKGDKLQRFTPQRLPSDDRLFRHGIGGVTSFMAREGITDLGEGFGEYLAQVREYHENLSPGGIKGYMDERVALKGRRYNTIRNGEQQTEVAAIDKAAATAYRNAKEGKDG